MSLLDILCSLNPDILGAMEIKDIFSNNEYYNSFERVDMILSDSVKYDDIETDEEDEEDIDDENSEEE